MTYTLTDIVICMRFSAKMLELADNDKPKIHSFNREQAELLRAAADDLEKRDNGLNLK